MPFIQTVNELADEIADLCGVYGNHDEAVLCPDDLRKACRICFVSEVAERIRTAVENERLLEDANARFTAIGDSR